LSLFSKPKHIFFFNDMDGFANTGRAKTLKRVLLYDN